ncbi:MAG: cytochrome c, partial [Nitrospirota bacterium]
PQQRGYGQTETDIGQCRRDCPNFRAIEDRIGHVIDFFLSPRVLATDLQEARENQARKKNPTATYTRDDLIDDLEKEFGEGAVSRGRVVFAENCARCHSSQDGPVETRDFYAISDKTGIRDDWLGNDQLTPVSEVGTNRCRALHSNHMDGHIWGQFSSTTYKQRPKDASVPDPADGGRGYYRNISLVNLWAHAPFLHDNSLGPEICGKPQNARNDFYRQSYVDGDGKLLTDAPGCVEYDPSVEGRFALYKASMEDLLHPDRRVPKITKLDEDIIIDVGPRLWDGEKEKPVLGLQVRVPAGTNAGLLGNFLHKEFLVDVVLSKTDPEALHDRLVAHMSDAAAGRVSAELGEVAARMFADPASLVGVLGEKPDLLATYSSCTDDVENKGHEFGGELPESDKQALIAFLATL